MTITINHLPDELLEHIFSYCNLATYGKATAVCKQWKTLLEQRLSDCVMNSFDTLQGTVITLKQRICSKQLSPKGESFIVRLSGNIPVVYSTS